LEGALELLLTVNSEFKGCMIKMAAKDAVDAMAGTSGMLARLQKNRNDAQREPLRQSCINRDASGDGEARIGGGDVPMGGMERVETVDELWKRKMTLIWENPTQYSDEYKRNMTDEWQMMKIKKLQGLKEKETNPAARNMLEEKYVMECKAWAYPAITHRPDHPESDYKTVEEMLREHVHSAEVIKYAQRVGKKMADEYRKNHDQQDPPVRVVPGGHNQKKYLEEDRKHLDYFIDQARLEAADPAKLAQGQQTMRQFMQHP